MFIVRRHSEHAHNWTDVTCSCLALRQFFRNLLLPVGMTKTRQRARYSVTVYRAEDLPRGDSGFLATVQRTFFTAKDSTAAFIDAFVRISFAGHIVSPRTLNTVFKHLL